MGDIHSLFAPMCPRLIPKYARTPRLPVIRAPDLSAAIGVSSCTGTGCGYFGCGFSKSKST